jgi:hypothetical protein
MMPTMASPMMAADGSRTQHGPRAHNGEAAARGNEPNGEIKARKSEDRLVALR